MGIQSLTRRAKRPLITGVVALTIATLATSLGGDWMARADDSSPSTLPNTLPPVSDPAAPASPEAAFAIPGDGEAGVAWAAPRTGDPGDVNSYVVTSVPESGTHRVEADERHLVVDGLVNGSVYVFSVAAIGPAGTSTSTAANRVMPDEGQSVTVEQLEKLDRFVQEKFNKAHSRFQGARGKALSTFEKKRGSARSNFEQHLGKAEAKFEQAQGQARAKLEAARGTPRFERVHAQVTEQLENAEKRLAAQVAQLEERLREQLGDLSEGLRERLTELHEKLSGRLAEIRQQILDRIQHSGEDRDDHEIVRERRQDSRGDDREDDREDDRLPEPVRLQTAI
ncbi:MAG: hypothetical protein O3C10_14110 [Chloroflexi bacterium]|nr:hypothetical protein [Chloroflexota bacterium]